MLNFRGFVVLNTCEKGFFSTSQIKLKRSTFGKKAKKGALWKFTLDLSHPVEDGILDSANFVSFLLKIRLNLGNYRFISFLTGSRFKVQH